MEKKLVINIYRKFPFDSLSEEFARPESRLNAGSSSCATGSLAAALLNRAAQTCPFEEENKERVEYIIRNTETIRNYMAYLVDEDVKCRAPIRKAVTAGGENEIAACCQTACAIAAEAVNMMQALLEMCDELCGYYPDKIPHFVFEAASLAYSAAESSVVYILSVTELSNDDTYQFVTRKENRVFLDTCRVLKERIFSKLNDLERFEVR